MKRRPLQVESKQKRVLARVRRPSNLIKRKLRWALSQKNLSAKCKSSRLRLPSSEIASYQNTDKIINKKAYLNL